MLYLHDITLTLHRKNRQPIRQTQGCNTQAVITEVKAVDQHSGDEHKASDNQSVVNESVGGDVAADQQSVVDGHQTLDNQSSQLVADVVTWCQTVSHSKSG